MRNVHLGYKRTSRYYSVCSFLLSFVYIVFVCSYHYLVYEYQQCETEEIVALFVVFYSEGTQCVKVRLIGIRVMGIGVFMLIH